MQEALLFDASLVRLVDNREMMTLRGAGIAAEFKGIVMEYIEKRFGGRAS